MKETIQITLTKSEIEELIHQKLEEKGYIIKDMTYHITSKRFDATKPNELVDVRCRVERKEEVKEVKAKVHLQ